MSRIGKQPIIIPKGVKVKKDENNIKVEGPNGKLSLELTEFVNVKVNEEQVLVENIETKRLSKSMWGLTRTLINNMIVGVTTGYSKVLEIHGLGYKAEIKGSDVKLQLGFSHDVYFKIPDGIKIDVNTKDNVITVSGIDNVKVGATAARIRKLKPPEPYKLKGIRYRGEKLRQKVVRSGIG